MCGPIIRIMLNDCFFLSITGKSDPFVVLKLGNVSHKTKVIKKNLNPVWSETFTFHNHINTDRDTLCLEVWDWDRFSKDDLLSRNHISLVGYAKKGTVDEWIPLSCAKPPSRGSIHLKVSPLVMQVLNLGTILYSRVTMLPRWSMEMASQRMGLPAMALMSHPHSPSHHHQVERERERASE